MSDVLPCPFCGSPAMYSLSKSANTRSVAKCSVMDCPGAGQWLYLEDWNKPRKTPDVQAMYAQFEESLRAERNRSTTLETLVSHLIQDIKEVKSRDGSKEDAWAYFLEDCAQSTDDPWRFVAHTLFAIKNYIEKI